jgi:hypothetical protein
MKQIGSGKGLTFYSSGDVIATTRSLVRHIHKDVTVSKPGPTTPPIG